MSEKQYALTLNRAQVNALLECLIVGKKYFEDFSGTCKRLGLTELETSYMGDAKACDEIYDMVVGK
ncbi:hypothetical protein [Salmonella enterica]|uniref:hypothetical protein n=1 Tax=Salmonella enterica TaxID=28901 RepID=UPI000B91664D|nr:hypothetical protein [Salmonella enterica]OXY50864.1 hypothetical protein P730_18820 [Salmonella enterica subsp. enterica serovar Enteritidis str. SHSE004]OXY63174.1 hypothetical protein P727_21290 [Salmonella enterica subsp. enterica serovar Enteritidis str. SHSE001]OXY69769.1 hypothetical protein P728_19835 [Salmonella enterica subsp. enterica serovar Enteritidis str. SHSE002]